MGISMGGPPLHALHWTIFFLYQCFISCDCWIIFHWMYILLSVYPFDFWWTFGLFPIYGYWKEKLPEYLYTNLGVRERTLCKSPEVSLWNSLPSLIFFSQIPANLPYLQSVLCPSNSWRVLGSEYLIFALHSGDLSVCVFTTGLHVFVSLLSGIAVLFCLFHRFLSAF